MSADDEETTAASLTQVGRTLAAIYADQLESIHEFAQQFHPVGVVNPEAPGWDELARRLALELTKLTPQVFRDHENNARSLKYYLDSHEGIVRGVDDAFGEIAELIDVPDSILAQHADAPLPDPTVTIARGTAPPEPKTFQARPTTLRILHAPKHLSPEINAELAAGQLWMLRTTAGFIPVGVISQLHPSIGPRSPHDDWRIHMYRCLLDDPNDPSFYPLVASNELLMAPLTIAERYFGPSLLRFDAADAPQPTPLERYYSDLSARAWNPIDRRFSHLAQPRRAKHIPAQFAEPIISVHRSDGKAINRRRTNEAPSGEWICPPNGLKVEEWEFAIEDSLSYYGLIPSPRPTYPGRL